MYLNYVLYMTPFFSINYIQDFAIFCAKPKTTICFCVKGSSWAIFAYIKQDIYILCVCGKRARLTRDSRL